MSEECYLDIIGLLTTYNLDIEQFPDNLKCSKCGMVLNDACLTPCGCRFCHICLDDLIGSGVRYCPGLSSDCGQSYLINFELDIEANESILQLTVKCPYERCTHECQLVNLNKHLQECSNKNEEYPCNEMGCSETSGYLQKGCCKNNARLLEMIENIEIENKNNKTKIEMLNQREKWSKKEIERMKQELVRNNDLIRTLMDNEILLRKENESIKVDKENLSEHVKILIEKMEEMLKRDKLDNVPAATDNNGETGPIQSIVNSCKNYFSSKTQNTESVRDDISSMKYPVLSKQTLMELGQVDANCELMIRADLGKISWGLGEKTSGFFSGQVHQYKYQLTSWNGNTTNGQSLWIWLLIYYSPNDEQLAWPFEGKVIITVSDKRSHTKIIQQQCRIERPAVDGYKCSKYFLFRHSDQNRTRLDLSSGVKISCWIWPGKI